jgi:hypothetical protein
MKFRHRKDHDPKGRRGMPAVITTSIHRIRSHLFSLVLLALASCLGAAATHADEAGGGPQNSHATRYGSGWECNRGYKASAQSCVAIEVPANAYLDSNGREWRCDRGYEKASGRCTRIEVPPNGFLGSRGSAWKCNRGHSKVGQSCVATAVPANAHLDFTGGGWNCDPGFQQRGSTCTQGKP